MRKVIILGLFFTVTASAQSIADTISFVHYNVLNYRNITDYCTISNNNPADKEGYIRTIIGYTMPDILTCNEIAGDGGTAANRLLTNALNKDGRDFYKQCAYDANSDLSNMLYYNKNKFNLYAQDKVEKAVGGSSLTRLINVFTLYYLDQSELDAGDTTFLTVYVAHLKASTGSVNVQLRADMTEALMAHLAANYKANTSYIISGDFNVYTNSEQGFQNLVNNANTAIRFYDPVNKMGSWNNNSSYASVHTQSTRVSGSCHSGGGLDDRFDFVLCGKEVLDNTRGMGYVAGSYTAVGNDGNHFNSDINSGTNSSVPKAVADALYGNSDHLPIHLKMTITRTVASVSERSIDNYLIVSNPVNNILQWKMQLPQAGKLEVRDLQGKLVYETNITASNTWEESDVTHWASGAYYVSFTTASGEVLRRKVVKL
jgi:exonuclease III